jgi:ribonuclease I
MYGGDDDDVKQIMSSTQYPSGAYSRINSMNSSSIGALSMNTVDYLSLPMQELLDEEDSINYMRHSTSMVWNRIVGGGIIFSVIASIIIAGMFYREEVLQKDHPVVADDDGPLPPSPSCYVSPTCTNYGLYSPVVYNPQGFTNLTGWHDVMLFDGCCDICVSITPTQSPTPSPTTLRVLGTESAATTATTTATTVTTGKLVYDYLILDLMWLPQFCFGLSMGHDITLSHPLSSKCVDSLYNNEPKMSIHGLWPSSNTSSVMCCSNGGAPVPTLDPVQVESWPIWLGLGFYWFDPTINTVFDGEACSVCYLLNHEWQKHGSCLAATTGDSLPRRQALESSQTGASPATRKDLDSDEFHYFQTGLYLRDEVGDELENVSKLVDSVILATSISDLFVHKVNVICDPQDSYPKDQQVGVFSELQICWEPVVANGVTTYQAIDCPPPYESNFQTACPEVIFVRPYAQ